MHGSTGCGPASHPGNLPFPYPYQSVRVRLPADQQIMFCGYPQSPCETKMNLSRVEIEIGIGIEIELLQ